MQAVLQEAPGEVQHVGSPVGLLGDPFQQRLLEGRKAKEEVLGLAELRGVAAEGAAGLQQVTGVEGSAAGVALVAPGPGVGAVGADALHVAVRQEARALAAVGQELVVGVNVALIQHRLEDVVGHSFVIGGVGVSEQVEGYAQLFPRLQEQGVIAVDHLGGGNSFLVGAYGDGGAVGIAAGHHQHMIAPEAVVAGEDVGRQVTARHVAQVQGAIGIGPGYSDKNALTHWASPYRPKA